MVKKFLIPLLSLSLLISALSGCTMVKQHKGAVKESYNDAGWNLIISENLLAKCSVEFNELTDLTISESYYDGLRVFIVLQNNTAKKYSEKDFFLRQDENITIYPNWFSIENNEIYLIFNCYEVSNNIRLCVMVNEKEYCADDFIVNNYNKKTLLPNKSFEELQLTKVEIAEHSILISGVITGDIDIENVKIEQTPNWVCSAHFFEQKNISENKIEFQALFTIKNIDELKFNLITTDANEIVTSIIPFELEV